MENCRQCGKPLKIIKGGPKSEQGSTKIVTVHVFGCMNLDCPIKMQEQYRTETEQDSFTE